MEGGWQGDGRGMEGGWKEMGGGWEEDGRRMGRGWEEDGRMGGWEDGRRKERARVIPMIVDSRGSDPE